MNNYELRILKNEKFYKRFLQLHGNIHDIQKIPIFYMPKNKRFTDFDNKIIYYLEEIKTLDMNKMIGITYDEFVNKEYEVIHLTTKIKGNRYGNDRYITYRCSYDYNVNKNIHDAILSKLQETYLLLKQIMDFKDINQYIIKMYADVIL